MITRALPDQYVWKGPGLVVDLAGGGDAITGVEPGLAFTAGEIWIPRDQEEAAVARGWRVHVRLAELVKVGRS